jgi:hypothetical protein
MQSKSKSSANFHEKDKAEEFEKMQTLNNEFDTMKSKKTIAYQTTAAT